MTTEYEAVTESEWKDLATTEITHQIGRAHV